MSEQQFIQSAGVPIAFYGDLWARAIIQRSQNFADCEIGFVQALISDEHVGAMPLSSQSAAHYPNRADEVASNVRRAMPAANVVRIRRRRSGDVEDSEASPLLAMVSAATAAKTLLSSLTDIKFHPVNDIARRCETTNVAEPLRNPLIFIAAASSLDSA